MPVPTFLTAVLMIGLAATATQAKETGEAERTSADTLFIAFPEMNVTLVERARIDGIMTVRVSLEVFDAEAQGQVELQQPRLQDAYIHTLTRLASARFDVRRPIDYALMGRYLQRDTNRILGVDVARVLVQDAILRRR